MPLTAQSESSTDGMNGDLIPVPVGVSMALKVPFGSRKSLGSRAALTNLVSQPTSASPPISSENDGTSNSPLRKSARSSLTRHVTPAGDQSPKLRELEGSAAASQALTKNYHRAARNSSEAMVFQMSKSSGIPDSGHGNCAGAETDNSQLRSFQMPSDDPFMAFSTASEALVMPLRSNYREHQLKLAELVSYSLLNEVIDPDMDLLQQTAVNETLRVENSRKQIIISSLQKEKTNIITLISEKVRAVLDRYADPQQVSDMALTCDTPDLLQHTRTCKPSTTVYRTIPRR